MATTNDLKDKINTKTLNMVLLTMATGGIYPILWLYKNYHTIDAGTETTTANDVFIIWIAVCAGLGGTFAGSGDVIFDVIAGILTIASTVLFIIWAFRARTALMEYGLQTFAIDLKMNRFYTVLFNVYYINYCINDLPEVERKQNILRAAKEPQAS